MGRNVKSVMVEWRAADPLLQAEYERLGPRFEAIDGLVAARKAAGLSQRALATLMGVAPSVVGRIESGSDSVKLDTLARAAMALGSRLRVTFEPVADDRPTTTSSPVETATVEPRTAAVEPRTATVRSAATRSRARAR